MFARLAPLVQERVAVLGEVAAMVDFFFLDDVDMDAAAFEKVVDSDPSGRALLAAALARFADVVWDASSLHAAVVELGEGLAMNLRKAQAPLRCAVTGRLVGPPLFESLEILGRAMVIRRLDSALARCSD